MTEPPSSTHGNAAHGDVTGNKRDIHTRGGAYVEGAVTVTNGDFISGDKITQLAPPIGVTALHQLPAPPGDFTGRSAELNQLRAEAHEKGVSILGLQGLGGVGKTALALVVANELAADYPDAQFYLDLQGVTRPLAPAAVMEHVLHAYAPTARVPEDPAERQAAYRSVLHGQRALLFFDNAANAEQLLPLLTPPGSLVLVTSRQKIALPGLVSLTLDSLPPAEAQALLLKRAPQIGDQAAALAERCGYLPLALTLAGSTLAERDDLEPADYLRRLERRRLMELDGVAASLGLSYDLLTSGQQHLWCQLSVCPAGFEAGAAAAIGSLDATAASGRLSDLLRLSLLNFDREAKRYRLHDLAREFARARLDDPDSREALRRHAVYYLAILNQVEALYLAGGPAVLRGLGLFDRERANILAGQAWAASQADQDAAVAQLTSDYADAGANLRDLRLSPAALIAWLEAGLAAAQRLGNHRREQMHLNNLGNAYQSQGETDRATAALLQSSRVAEALGDQHGAALALGNLALAARARGDLRQVVDYSQRSLAIHRALGDRRNEGAALGNLAAAYTDLGDADQAIACCEQARPILRQLGDLRGEAQVLNNLGIAYATQGRLAQAADWYQQALQIAEQLGDRRLQAQCLGNLGITQAGLGHAREAMAYQEKSGTIAREIGDRSAEAATLGGLSLAHFALGEIDQAIQLGQQQIALNHDLRDRAAESKAIWNLGLIYQQRGDLDQAVAQLQQSADMERELGHPTAAAAAAYVATVQARQPPRPADV